MHSFAKWNYGVKYEVKMSKVVLEKLPEAAHLWLQSVMERVQLVLAEFCQY